MAGRMAEERAAGCMSGEPSLQRDRGGMTPPFMAPWVFLFGLTVSCILMWGAGPETPQASLQDKWRSEQGTVPAKIYRSMVQRFVRVRAQLLNAHEERHRERKAWSSWETQASSWHTAVLAIAGITGFLVGLCCRLRGLRTSCTEASTQSDMWRGEQDSGQVGMAADSGQEDIWPPHSMWCPVATVLRSWTRKEGWEDMDGSPASVENALQALAERLPEEEKATAGRMGWMFLTALSLNTENALNKMAQVPDKVSWLEVLEARVRLLEQGPQGGDSEAEAEEANRDHGAPNPQARPIFKHRVKREQPLGPGGVAAGNPAVTEFTTYTPYTPPELQKLGRRYRQRPGEPVSAWLLRLWDEGADSILCSPGEMEKLAFVTFHPSLRQRLQNCHRLANNQGNHSLMKWLTAAVRTIWDQAGELPDTVSQCQSYTELMQIIREMGMRRAIYNLNMQGPDDELFTASMRDLVLDTVPASAFGSLVAILTPYVGRRIHEVTTAMATLGNVESRRRRKLRQEVCTVETGKPKPKVKGQGRGPQRVTCTQMWCDLVAAGVDRKKIARQPNALLLELWKQLRLEQQFRWSIKEEPREEREKKKEREKEETGGELVGWRRSGWQAARPVNPASRETVVV